MNGLSPKSPFLAHRSSHHSKSAHTATPPPLVLHHVSADEPDSLGLDLRAEGNTRSSGGGEHELRRSALLHRPASPVKRKRKDKSSSSAPAAAHYREPCQKCQSFLHKH